MKLSEKVRAHPMRSMASALLLGAALMVVTPVGAHVNDNFAHLWNDHIKEKTDARYLQQKEGDARYAKRANQLWAVVKWDGEPTAVPELVRGRGVKKVEQGENATQGTTDDPVRVYFNRNVGRCSYNATVNREDLDVDSEIVADINVNNGETDYVTVQTANSNGQEDTQGFSLLVTC